MLKKRMLRVICILAMCAAVLCGCGGTKFTVTYLDSDGTTVLKTEKVTEGEMAENYVPEKEGYTFMGWYATPTLTHEFDFSQAIAADTSVYAGFTVFEEDNRTFAVVGSGVSPLLLSSNWGKTINEEHYLVKEDVEGVNQYTITMDLLEGDLFQFAIDTTWADQRGAGYMSTLEKDGTAYFANAAGLGDEGAKKANIKCLVSGNYTFTLTTYPANDYYDTENEYYTEEGKENYNLSDYDKIDWVYNGEASASAEVTTTYYLKGAGITGWKDVYTDRVAMTKNEDGTDTLTVALKEGEEFLFTSLVSSGATASAGTEYLRFTNITDDASKEFIEGNDSANMIAKADGTYTFTYDEATTNLTVTFDPDTFIEANDYYVKGTFGGTNWATELDPAYQLKETEAGSYVYVLESLELAEGDEFGMESMVYGSAGNGMSVEEARVLFYNYDAVAPAGDDNDNANITSMGGAGTNMKAAASGTYTVTFDAYTGELTFVLNQEK